MQDTDTKRLTRLIAILTQLQAKKIITSAHLSQKFGVSVRTIYRDIKTLVGAGVPIIAIERKGYTLMKGYRMPPIMFTESEANALITSEQLLLKNSDSSFIVELSNATNKIKAVLQYTSKDKVELLSERITISPMAPKGKSSNQLILIQNALTDFKIIEIVYISESKNETTNREIEPFALYYNLQESWTLIAYCRLRKDFRMFKLDRISSLNILDTHFKPHKLTLQAFLEGKRKNFLNG